MTLPADLVARGFNSEADRHRRNLGRELADAAKQIEAARADLADGKVNTRALREAVRTSADAYQHGAALAALNAVRFALPNTEGK
ncbi:hypothetical protein ABZY58_11365 [Micromonospora tulbaghiae]|uniref:hypothetical protein n=1 Tax=Micromonospora tulbaghiae TaxID=479978 RepID=UPI0033B838F7